MASKTFRVFRGVHRDFSWGILIRLTEINCRRRLGMFFVFLLLLLRALKKKSNLMFYSLDKLKPKTKTKNLIFLLSTSDLVDISTFLYTLNREDKNTFSPSKKMFSCPPYSKCIKKLFNFHLHQQKKFVFFSF